MSIEKVFLAASARCWRSGFSLPLRRMSYFMMIFLISAQVFAQQRVLKGVVTNNKGEPIPGVAVVIKGTTEGTVTDVDGIYSISGVEPSSTLVFSFVGMVTREVIAGSNSKLDVILEEDLVSLEEFVVVGYGTARKSELTGSVATIKAKSFLEQPASSSNSILSGRAPGVTVRKSNGAPGEGHKIRIRGANSLLGKNDPLIVVDGNYTSSLPEMYDIESIEILKDASATAIYGSRGANGVILVTTRRGVTQDKPTLEWYSNVSFDQVMQRYDLMNAYEFAEYNNSVGAYPFTQQEIDRFRNDPGVDWQDQIFRTGISQNHKLIFRGGSKSVKYFVSPWLRNATGIVRNTEAKAYGLSTKVDIDLSDRLTFQFESHLRRNENLNPQLAQGGSKTAIPLMSALIWAPTESIFNEDGTYRRLGIGSGSAMNPVLLTEIESRSFSTQAMTVGNVMLNIAEGLDFNAKGIFTLSTGAGNVFESKQYNGVNALASKTSSESKEWLVNAFLTYRKTIASKLNVSAMAGFEETKYNSEALGGGTLNLPIETAKWYNLGLGAPNITVASSWGNSALRSYFGRVNLSYASKYFLTANYRADGSSKFREQNQFSYFPSFSLAWKLSEESFLKSQNVFQEIKLRGGWGVTGSQAIDSYATYSTLGGTTYGWGGVPQPGYYARVGGNPNLKWESTEQFDVGLDVSTLNNRMQIVLDYYHKKTRDLLAPVTIPAYNGGGTVVSNIGMVENKGFEIGINYDLIRKDNFSYDVSLNGSINRNKVIDIGEQELIWGDTYAPGVSSTSPFVLMPGQPIGTIYGLKYLGIWQEKDAEQAARYQQTPGDYRYEDLNGNGSYDAGDNQVIGNTNPSFTWGFNNHLSYKGFSLNVLFEGVHGRDVLNWSYLMASERIDLAQTYTLREARDRWSPMNTGAKFAKIGNSNRLTPLSSQFVEDASYIKLRNISLSNRIPKSLISVGDLRVSASAQNILTITRYKGYDPEVSSTSSDNISTGVSDANSGMDWFAYPNPRSFTLGLTLTY